MFNKKKKVVQTAEEKALSARREMCDAILQSILDPSYLPDKSYDSAVAAYKRTLGVHNFYNEDIVYMTTSEEWYTAITKLNRFADDESSLRVIRELCFAIIACKETNFRAAADIDETMAGTFHYNRDVGTCLHFLLNYVKSMNCCYLALKGSESKQLNVDLFGFLTEMICLRDYVFTHRITFEHSGSKHYYSVLNGIYEKFPDLSNAGYEEIPGVEMDNPFAD